MKIMNETTGANWTEYEILAYRPRLNKKLTTMKRTYQTRIEPDAIADIGTNVVVKRAVTEFEVKNFPMYTKHDITDLHINAEPENTNLVCYKIRISYLRDRGDQV